MPSGWARPCGCSGRCRFAPTTSPICRSPLSLGEPGAVNLTAEIAAVPAPAARSVEILAVGPDGETVARVPVTVAADAGAVATPIEIPPDLRNRIARIELQPAQGIAGAFLLDERWRRRSVGLVGPARSAADQPLLAELYFIERALRPFAEVREGSIAALLEQPLSLLVMADASGLDAEERGKLDAWLEAGGVLLRFAGPKLAASTDDLVPARLRAGDRILGGALSWSEPLPLAPFPPESPFAGLPVTEEVRVSRQVLAEPGPDLAGATMASLSDGTPIVTGARRGKGWLILVHTTANTAWTTLPLSGLFVEMMERVLALGPGVGGAERASLEPSRLLDGFGRLVEPQGAWAATPPDAFATAMPGPRHPPGLYAPIGQRADGTDGEAARSALNLQRALTELVPLGRGATGGAPEPYTRAAERDLAPSLVLAALLLALLDLVIALALRGLLPARRLAPPATAAVLLLLAMPGLAQDEAADERILDLTRETRLAYVVTGRADIDSESEAGLKGLTRVLSMRTSIEAARPLAGRRRRRRPGSVPAPLLAGPARSSRPRRRCRRARRGLSGAGRHDPVRHPRRRRPAPRPGGRRPRRASPGRAAARHRPAAADAAAGRPRAHPLILPPPGLPRSLVGPADLGRPGARRHQ